MPNIKPISDLRNYSEVLRDVAVGAPVFLTKNGRGRYAIVDMQDYEKTQATLRLMNELAKGRRSGETEGWLTLEEVEVYTPTAPVQRTFGEKLASAFSDGWNGFVRGFQRLCIGLVSALPALVLLAILVVIVLLIVRKLRKKHAAKREKQAQAAKPDAPEGT